MTALPLLWHRIHVLYLSADAPDVLIPWTTTVQQDRHLPQNALNTAFTFILVPCSIINLNLRPPNWAALMMGRNALLGAAPQHNLLWFLTFLRGRTRVMVLPKIHIMLL